MPESSQPDHEAQAEARTQSAGALSAGQLGRCRPIGATGAGLLGLDVMTVVPGLMPLLPEEIGESGGFCPFRVCASR